MRDPEQDEPTAATATALPSTSSGRTPPRPTPTLDDFQLPPRYQPVRIIGQGGMGSVLEVYDASLQRHVAVKVLAADRLADRDYRVRFLREARAAATLQHPNIVTVHDIDEDGEFIVMELVPGQSLKERIAQRGKLAPVEVRRLGADLLAALAAAHRAGIVHRDVKPGNLIIDRDERVKLADFGVASFGDSELTSTGTRIGTPAYMAPEQLRGRDVDARADVYAAGATLFEAATGAKLHPKEGRVRDPRAAVLEATGDEALADAIASAVAERPSDRFADAGMFQMVLADGAARERAPSWPRRPRPRLRRVPWVAASVAVVAAAAAGGWWWLGSRGDRAAPAPPAEPVAVALLPFVDRTGDPRLDFAASGLPHLLGSELRRSEDLRVLGYYQLLDRVSGPGAPADEWRAVARDLGAAVLIRGEVERAAAGEVRVTIAVEGLAHPARHQVAVAGAVDDVPRLVREAAPEIASLALGSERAFATGAARSFGVERELQLGIAALERQDFATADGHLRAALAGDASVTEAYYHLAVLYWWQGREEAQVLAMIDGALAGSLGEAERAFADGLRLLVRLEYPHAVSYFRELAARYPDHRDIQYGLFEAMFHGGQPAHAMTAYRRVRALSPRFRLGRKHPLHYFAARGDARGLDWILADARGDRDREAVVWTARAATARRRHADAIALLERALEDELAGDAEIRRELVKAYAVGGQLRLALDLAERLARRDPGAEAIALAALHRAAGLAEREREWWSKALHAAELGVPGPTTRDPWLDLIALAVAGGSEDDVRAVAEGLQRSWGGEDGRMVEVDTARALVAGSLGDAEAIERARRSHFPEVAAVGDAWAAARRGDHAVAAVAWQRAADHSGDGRYRTLELWLAAAARRAAGDPSAVYATCAEVVEPPLVTWAWAATVGPCLQWSAEAATDLGRDADARTRWRQLSVLRSAAPADDPLAAAAREGLKR